MERLSDPEYRRKAQEIYASGTGGQFGDGDINVDDDAIVSESDEGAYVAAWVWVPGKEIADASSIEADPMSAQRHGL